MLLFYPHNYAISIFYHTTNSSYFKAFKNFSQPFDTFLTISSYPLNPPALLASQSICSNNRWYCRTAFRCLHHLIPFTKQHFLSLPHPHCYEFNIYLIFQVAPAFRSSLNIPSKSNLTFHQYNMRIPLPPAQIHLTLSHPYLLQLSKNKFQLLIILFTINILHKGSVKTVLS